MEDRQPGSRVWRRSTPLDLRSESQMQAVSSDVNSNVPAQAPSGPILVPMNHLVASSMDPERQIRLEKIETALKLLDLQKEKDTLLPMPSQQVQNPQVLSPAPKLVIELRWDYLAQVFVALLFVYMAWQFHSMQERIVFLEASMKAMA